MLVLSKIRNKALISILTRIPTPRQKKFLYQSGVWKWAKKDFQSRSQFKGPRSSYIFPVIDSLTIIKDNLYFKYPTLTESFRNYFTHLETAIQTGIIHEFSRSNFISKKVLNPNRVVLRTRNYRLKQPNHNTTIEDVQELVNQLAKAGFNIVNIGNPALSLLDLFDHPEYCEIDNKLNINEELSEIYGPVVTRADAGLFVLIACLPYPLVCLTDEWNKFLGVDLMSARKIAGMTQDLTFPATSDEIQGHLKVLRMIK